MKKKIIIISSIVGIILILLIIIFCINIFYIKKMNKLKEENKQTIEDNNKIINEYEKKYNNTKKELEEIKKENKILTKKQLEKIPCEEKDDIIIALQDDKGQLVFIAESLMKSWQGCIDQLSETNYQLIKSNKALKVLSRSNAIQFYIMGGISGLNEYLENQKINIDLIFGIDYIKYLINNRLGLSAGGWIKVYDDIGFGGKLGLIFSLGKK